MALHNSPDDTSRIIPYDLLIDPLEVIGVTDGEGGGAQLGAGASGWRAHHLEVSDHTARRNPNREM
jgi:hypothetical protein